MVSAFVVLTFRSVCPVASEEHWAFFAKAELYWTSLAYLLTVTSAIVSKSFATDLLGICISKHRVAYIYKNNSIALMFIQSGKYHLQSVQLTWNWLNWNFVSAGPQRLSLSVLFDYYEGCTARGFSGQSIPKPLCDASCGRSFIITTWKQQTELCIV